MKLNYGKKNPVDVSVDSDLLPAGTGFRFLDGTRLVEVTFNISNEPKDIVNEKMQVIRQRFAEKGYTVEE
jgi:hypothetical protein